MADMSFDEVARELGVSDEELKRMVAENEIRAFHQGGELRFKREDVNQLKNRLETAPTIVLSDTEAQSILEEPVLEEPLLDDGGLDEPLLDAGGLDEPLLDDAVLEEPLAGADDAMANEETVLSVEGLLDDESISLEEPGGDAGGLLEGDSVGDDTVLDSGLLEEEDLSLGLDETEEDGLLEGGEVRSAPRRVRARPQESNPVMTGLLVVMSVLLVLPGAVLVNLAGGDNGVFPTWIEENLTALNGLVDSIIGLF